MPTRLQLARKAILTVFDGHDSRVFRRRDLELILAQNRAEWRLAERTTVAELVAYLTKRSKLRRLDFPFPLRKEIRYAWGDVPLSIVLMTLKPHCYFSHYTAVHMHDLTEQEPKTIYVNFEQPPKLAPEGSLVQERIDAAFARKPRMSKNVARFKQVRVCLLNGKHTGYLGVESHEVSAGDDGSQSVVRVTDIERTLIDIAVRPFYAGGVGEVLKAYRLAAPKVSMNRLAGLLSQIAHTYPYHQAIGFYLERSGAYKAGLIDVFRRKFARDFDFYLTYNMNNARYDERWRLFVPQGF